MNRFYAIESTPSLTGAKADHRLVLKAGEIEGFARQLSGSLGAGSGSSPSPGSRVPSPEPANADAAKWVAALAKDLQAHRGTSLVVAGDYQPAAVHAAAHAMNQALGNVGATVTYGAAIEAAPADQAASLNELVRSIDAGQVELLVILGGNPVYTAPADLKFSEKLVKVGMTVYHGLHVDETANLCQWNVAEAHPLESWGDARAYDGTVTIIQPLIAPLYEGRSAHELLGVFTAQPDRHGSQIVKDYWTRAFGGASGWSIRGADGLPFKDADTFWRRALHDGFIGGTAIADGGQATPFTAPSAAAPAAAAAAPPRPPRRRAAVRGRAGSARDHLPARSDDLGRPLREQRLAPGAAQAADEDHVGPVGVDQPAARQGTRPERRRRDRAALSRQHRAHARVPGPRPSRAVRHGVSRLRQASWPAGSALPRPAPRRSTPTSFAPPTPRGSAAASRSRRPAIATCSRRRRSTI